MVHKFFLSALLLAFFIKPVFAGGGLISFKVEPSAPIMSSEEYTVTATVLKDGQSICQNCKTQFFVDDLHSSKYTIIQQNEKTNNLGEVSATFKLTSDSSANMVIYAVADNPNSYRSSSYLLSFLQSDNTQVTPAPNIVPITTRQFPLTIAANHPVEGLKGKARLAFVSWQPIKGADYYDVKLRPTDYENWAIPQDSPTRNTSMNVILSSDTDYYVQVDACNSSECVSSDTTFVKKQTNTSSNMSPILGDKNVEDLKKQVDALEKKTEAVEKKQNGLQSQISRITNFLKSLFPFFK